MSQPAISLVVVVQREQALDSGAWVWTALPQGYPGSAGGRTIAELHEEVEALKHFAHDLYKEAYQDATRALRPAITRRIPARTMSIITSAPTAVSI